MTIRLFLVRHGESIWNAERRIQGRADPSLSDLGTRQAAALSDAFRSRPIDVVMCSSLVRAHVTAAAIGAPHGLEPRVETALSEIHLGSREGQRSDTVGALPSDLSGDRAIQGGETWPPDGETLHQAWRRVAPVIDGIVSSHSDATIVLVTHSIIGRIVICHLLGAGLELVPHLKLKLASVSMVRCDEHGAVLERLGDTNHLRRLDASGAPAHSTALASGRR